MLPLLLLRQRVAMILKMYRRRFHFPCPLRAAMACGRRARSPQLASSPHSGRRCALPDRHFSAITWAWQSPR